MLLTSTTLFAALLEGGARIFIRPSPMSYGTLLGRELPPVRVVPPPALAPVLGDVEKQGDPQGMTWGDLQGVLRTDPLLGYAPLERATSRHGWWTTNDIGARSTVDTPPTTTPGRPRILLFGESLASGSRLRQPEALPTLLAAEAADLEIVDLAVDGYSMAQSLLRFRETTRRTDYDVAILGFAPAVDLWRDVNTVRSLAKPSWATYIVMPRFVLDGGRLTLVRSPYENPTDVYADNALALGDTLRRHLVAYDRFYFRTRFESPPFIGRLVLWKIAAAFYADVGRARLFGSVGSGHVDLDSEAMRVSREIFATMRDETRARGKQFVLLILPEHSGLGKIRRDRRSAENWRRVVAAACADVACIDVTPALLAAPPDELDRGYDGSHYGPRMSRVVATAIEEGLRRLGVAAHPPG